MKMQNTIFEIPKSIRKQFINIPQNSENKPWGLYFLKVLFEGLIFGGADIRRGLFTDGNLRFKIDWASLIIGSEFTVFAFFYFCI